MNKISGDKAQMLADAVQSDSPSPWAGRAASVTAPCKKHATPLPLFNFSSKSENPLQILFDLQNQVLTSVFRKSEGA